ncbi:cell division protein ZapE [Rhodococcus sp. IEGM 1408]|uniref:cell division protein ZapE n=1 Tax=Rhodococcus sp. IEGM 1408 TaxID=3082220 RepID=UPI0029559EFA|nr:cell division protein ZapE [Rhodococcus sp. IEGM 1408]MDV7999988.1 cell division protein ZapE [Rhodococcus sp. IEGM 1408]
MVSMGGRDHVYVYGPPGSGKTTLLDSAHSEAPESVRWHCAEFFRAVHAELPGHGRDLETTVRALTGRARAVFFDEFHVHDVADAIYLHRALTWWCAHRVRVIATSNYVPEELLPNSLLHAAAEPVISLIRSRFAVIDLDEGIDHRATATGSEKGFTAGGWLPPLSHKPSTSSLTLGNRSLPVLSQPMGTRTIETTFAALCELPWSTSDYLTLLADRSPLVIHDVPHPAQIGREPGQRLANLVDVAYDVDAPLTIHSPGTPDDLAASAFPPLDVARTVSRLRSLRASHH